MNTNTEIEEMRGEDRVSVSLPVNIADSFCFTRDVSASAVFIESAATFNVGDEVGFTIEFDSPSGKLILKSNGEVVRVERRDGKFGAAVRIVESVMESADVSISTDSNKVLSSTCKTASLHIDS